MCNLRLFFRYVIPSVLSFALSGVYAIVDGFFVGNSAGDLGLSAINMAYPLVAVLQALGTGIGMGGAIYYSIYKAEKKEELAKRFAAGALWGLVIASGLSTCMLFFLNDSLLKLLGARDSLLALGRSYIAVIALGAGLQIMSTGLIPFIRNHGGSFYAMLSMIAGFITNIALDYLFVWIWEQGMAGAAWATIIGQGVTMLMAIVYLLYKKQLTLRISPVNMGSTLLSVLKIGIAPFGLTMIPNISLIIINRFSVAYGGEKAIAVYACISYIICVVYLILQGVGDGSQPLLSQYYGERELNQLKGVRRTAYGFAMMLSVAACLLMYLTRQRLGLLFGASQEVNEEIIHILPIFLISIPFDAVSRITTASFYATEKSLFSYILILLEPLLMVLLMLILPRLGGGQMMIWQSAVLAKVLAALLALILKRHTDRQIMPA
ncbi:MAG: multidrug transporter MatE [Lachnospiraceae bacterium]|nr:multidrug transporter MatE [Lachnospiraceae bacterium]